MSGIESGASAKRRSPRTHGPPWPGRARDLRPCHPPVRRTRLLRHHPPAHRRRRRPHRPGIYHYVKSKDDLLSRLLAEYTEDSASQINTIAGRTDLDSPSRLREIVALLARRQGEHAARFRLIIRSEGDLRDALATRYEKSRRAVLRTVDARVAALGILGMVNCVAWWFDADHNDDLDAISNQLADTAVAGLRDASGRQAVNGPHAAIAAIRAKVDRLERTPHS
jgi:AcrR family transcriptional regulator